MTKTLSGNTYEYRDRLKQLGGRWNAANKNWDFDYLRAKDEAELKNMTGCILTDAAHTPAPAPTPEPYADDYSADIMRIINGETTERATDGKNKTVMYGDDPTYFNHFKDKNPVSFFGFSSLSEMIKFIGPDRTPDACNGYETANASWYGTPNMKAAMQLARDGWKDGVSRALKVLEMLNVEHAVAKHRTHGVAGGSVNIGRMLSGNPAHMRQRPKLPGKRIIKLFVQNAAASFMNERVLATRAAIIAAISDILEMNGYSCEIVSISTMDFISEKPASQIAVTLKAAGEKLNLDDLVFALGHPSFLRRFTFACTTKAPELRSMWRYQGLPRDAFNKTYKPGRGEFYICKIDANQTDVKELLKLVLPEGLPIEIGA